MKDSHFAHANEWSSFKSHMHAQLNNSHYSYSFHVNFYRDTACVAGNVPYYTPKNDRDFDSNPPTNELGFVDDFLEQRVLFAKHTSKMCWEC